jgi:Cdc6-like AAA superfamily ATPase
MASAPHEREPELMRSFSPASPINDATLFAGRKEQRRDVRQAIHQRGQHVLVFGERGVGKTSLANILEREFSAMADVVAIRVNCDKDDDFTSIWRKILDEMVEAGPTGKGAKRSLSARFQGKKITPNDVKQALSVAAEATRFVLIIDEFDRPQGRASGLFADTIKTLSDHDVPATIVLVGVADSVSELMKEHASVERALVQVPMPRMYDRELAQIVVGGLERVSMTITERALKQITDLSQGLPHYTHLLGLNAALEANDRHRTEVIPHDVDLAIRRAVEKAQESIKQAHYNATVSPRRDNLFTHVLLACALTKPDARGSFSAAEIRDHMRRITNKEYDIPAFSQHLNDFCDKKRGPILERMGSPRRYRFRFANPLMQPYVIMHGLSKEIITNRGIRS